MNEPMFDLAPGEVRHLSVAVEPSGLPLILEIEFRGRRGHLEIESEEIVWTRLPVPWHRRAWALLTGRNRWTWEGWPMPGLISRIGEVP